MSHGSEKRARSSHLTVRLSVDERAAVETAAEKAGLTAGSYARQAMLGAPAPRQVRRPPVEKRELARLLGELGKIGGNLNQLARAANTGVVVYESEIDASLGDLAEVRTAILKALGRAP
jgi:mobilization protein NikA